MTPLAGLKVVELARILAGPWAGQLFADMGAEVIKVEAPSGDDTRTWGPPFIEHDGETSAAYFHGCNRGKKSVTIDFRTEEGQAHVKALLADADIVITAPEQKTESAADKYPDMVAEIRRITKMPELIRFMNNLPAKMKKELHDELEQAQAMIRQAQAQEEAETGGQQALVE